MVLWELKEQERGMITALHAPQAFAKRLRDMGFCEGEEVVCLKHAVFSSPVLFQVKNARVALRKKDAALIEVSV